MTTEKALQRWTIEEAERRGILCQKLESRSSRGWPDLLLMKDGVVVFLELKSPKGTGKLSPLQYLTAMRIEGAGGIVRVAENKTEVVEALEIFDDKD